MNWVRNRFKEMNAAKHELAQFTEKEIERVHHFHASMPGYEPTPLYVLADLSQSIGVGGIYVKDESKRFGLKGLGGSFAMASYFSKKFSLDVQTTNFPQLMEHVKALPVSTFATVTAGNHGRGVAWAAGLFRQRAKVYMQKGTSRERLKAIRELGAEAYISNDHYDDTVQQVAQMAAENHWVLMQDTAWEGYETVPLDIMKGYTTIVAEIAEQLKSLSVKGITHVFLQAGVGSFAASVAAAICNLSRDNLPKIAVVEPSEAACFYQSALSKTGEPQRVYGSLSTMMAGLACGEPNPFAWNILKTISDYFFACEDSISATGMRLLAKPVGGDPPIVSGESRAVTVGLLYELMTNRRFIEIKNKMELDETSNVLVINTEGDTDPVHYKKIVAGV